MAASENPYRIREEPGQRILEIDYSKNIHSPSIESSEIVMADTINKIIRAGRVTQIEFKQQEDILYPADQTELIDSKMLPVTIYKFPEPDKIIISPDNLKGSS